MRERACKSECNVRKHVAHGRESGDFCRGAALTAGIHKKAKIRVILGALACESVTFNSAQGAQAARMREELAVVSSFAVATFFETQKASRGGSLFVCVRFWSLTCTLCFGRVANLCASLGWLIRLRSGLLTYALIFYSAAYSVALALVLCGFVSGFCLFACLWALSLQALSLKLRRFAAFCYAL